MKDVRVASLGTRIRYAAVHRLSIPLRAVARGLQSRQRRDSGRRAVPEEPDRILVCALNKGIGDMVLASALFIALKQAFPRAELAVVARSHMADLISRFHSVDRVIPHDPTRVHPWELIRFLRARRFDVAIDIHENLFFGEVWIPAFSGATITMGSNLGLKGTIFHKTIHHNSRCHVVDFYLSFLPLLGRSVPEKVEFERDIVREEAEEGARRFLADRGLDEGSALVGIQPGARDMITKIDKRWPRENVIELIRRLDGKRARVILLGSREEVTYCEGIAQEAGTSPLIAAGQTSLFETMALIQHCSAVVCNNSGILHLAVLFDVPTISFSGGINLLRWGPYGDAERHHVLFPDEHCSSDHCMICADTGPRCLRRVSPDQVLKEVERRLKA